MATLGNTTATDLDVLNTLKVGNGSIDLSVNTAANVGKGVLDIYGSEGHLYLDGNEIVSSEAQLYLGAYNDSRSMWIDRYGTLTMRGNISVNASANNAYDIGSSTLQFNNSYVNNSYADTFYGYLAGTANTAENYDAAKGTIKTALENISLSINGSSHDTLNFKNAAGGMSYPKINNVANASYADNYSAGGGIETAFSNISLSINGSSSDTLDFTNAAGTPISQLTINNVNNAIYADNYTAGGGISKAFNNISVSINASDSLDPKLFFKGYTGNPQNFPLNNLISTTKAVRLSAGDQLWDNGKWTDLANTCFSFSVINNNINVNGLPIPQYSKGQWIGAGGKVVTWTTSTGVFYYAFHNNTSWTIGNADTAEKLKTVSLARESQVYDTSTGWTSLGNSSFMFYVPDGSAPSIRGLTIPMYAKGYWISSGADKVVTFMTTSSVQSWFGNAGSGSISWERLLDTGTTSGTQQFSYKRARHDSSYTSSTGFYSESANGKVRQYNLYVPAPSDESFDNREMIYITFNVYGQYNSDVSPNPMVQVSPHSTSANELNDTTHVCSISTNYNGHTALTTVTIEIRAGDEINRGMFVTVTLLLK